MYIILIHDPYKYTIWYRSFSVENGLNFQQMSSVVVLSEALFLQCALRPEVQTEDAKTIFREQVNDCYDTSLCENNSY